jgi:hypothetical protein
VARDQRGEPPTAERHRQIGFLTGLSKGPSLFLLFLQEIISEGRSFTAGILGRRRRSERKNSEITACSGRTG